MITIKIEVVRKSWWKKLFGKKQKETPLPEFDLFIKKYDPYEKLVDTIYYGNHETETLKIVNNSIFIKYSDVTYHYKVVLGFQKRVNNKLRIIISGIYILKRNWVGRFSNIFIINGDKIEPIHSDKVYENYLEVGD